MAFSWRNWRRKPLSTDERGTSSRPPAPVPCIWLYGKTGSGKTSVVRYLTGAADATIGEGYRPETRTSRRFDFPAAEEPLLTFMDTRGLGEASYDPTDDLEAIGQITQLMIVTVRVTDHALEGLLVPLRQIRKRAPERPIILALTCLHDATGPLDLSAGPDPFLPQSASQDELPKVIPDSLQQLLSEKQRQFAGLYDHLVPIDLTRVDDGFANPDFGGQRLKQTILDHLPQAYRQALLALNDSTYDRQSYRHKRTRWQTLASSALAGSVGAVPVPWVDIPAVLGIQTHLAIRIAKIYDQEITTADWTIFGSAATSRIAIQMGIREFAKFVPIWGNAVGAAGSFAFTYALGMSWGWYFTSKRNGKVPSAEELKSVFAAELERGRELWSAS